MTRQRTIVPAFLTAAALLVAAGCGGGGTASGGGSGAGGSSGASGSEPVVEETGVAIADITELTLEGEFDVSGWVVQVGDKVFLCTTATGTPPTCGKPSLELVGYDGDVPSAAEVTILGEVAGKTLTVAG